MALIMDNTMNENCLLITFGAKISLMSSYNLILYIRKVLFQADLLLQYMRTDALS